MGPASLDGGKEFPVFYTCHGESAFPLLLLLAVNPAEKDFQIDSSNILQKSPFKLSLPDLQGHLIHCDKIMLIYVDHNQGQPVRKVSGGTVCGE